MIGSHSTRNCYIREGGKDRFVFYGVKRPLSEKEERIRDEMEELLADCVKRMAQRRDA
jgi:hypothetical protein